MAALQIRFTATLRTRWRSWLALALLSGLIGGLVLALAAASHRADTVLPRFYKTINAADAYVDPGFGFGEESLNLDRIARLPEVVESERNAQLAALARSSSGKPILPLGADGVSYVVPSDGHPADTIDRAKLIDGRLPDPSKAGEALADSHVLRTLGLHVGDTLTLGLITHDSLWNAKITLHLTADPTKDPFGPIAKVRIVGADANARVAVDGGQMHLTPAFYRRYGGKDLGSWVEELQVRLRHGQADLPKFQADVHRIAGKLVYGFFVPSVGHPQLQRSIDLQAKTLLGLAGLLAVGGLLLVGQALLRQSAVESRDDATLQALGMTRRQLLALGAARSAAIAVPGTALSLAVALALSPLAPFGRARELEPDLGVHVDPLVFAVGGAAILLLLLVLGAFATWRSSRGHAAVRGGARHRLAALPPALARAGLGPPVVAGVRMAVVGGRGRASRVPVRATLTAAVLAVAVTVLAFTFAASLQHLLNTPALYGQTWDFEPNAGPDIGNQMITGALHDPGVVAAAGGSYIPVRIGSHDVAVRGFDDLRGAMPYAILEGRPPRSVDEAVVGTKTMRQLGLHVGDRVTIRNGPRSISPRIVGRGVIPGSKVNKLSEGAQVLFAALKTLQPEAVRDIWEFKLARGAAGASAHAHLVRIYDGSSAATPQEVGDFGGVKRMPLFIAAVFAGAAAAALAHALVTSVRRRRRDLAMLKTLGFTRGQVAAAVAWQASTIASIGALIGIPLGLGVGRLAWNLFAENLGVVPDVVTPVGLTALVFPAAILLAVAVALLPGWTAARTRPAVVLRAE
ncbi:MAG: FtsX-like permease family protein [Thermoleophilaceae bacterium]